MDRHTTSDLQSTRLSSITAPRSLRDFRDLHCNDTILVCGCGVSLGQVERPEDFVTIGVNDVGRLFQPNYLVVLNPRGQFSGDRFQYVEHSQASAVFSQLNLGINHTNLVRFRLGRRGGVDISDPDSLPYTRNSPYVAVCLALYMGAKRIGLIGVDFTRDHFFANTGTHSLMREFPTIDLEYKRLYEACVARGVEFFNLSDVSRLTALPKISFDEFNPRLSKRRSLAIVSYSVTPVAGVPVILSQCISSRTLHSCRTVWATHSYGNGVSFDSDVEWKSSPGQAEELLRAADLVVVHNGKVEPRHKTVIADKPVVTMAHNYMWNVDTTYVDRGMPGVVVGQYQATLPEFKNWDVVPNPLPTWDPIFQPGTKNPGITICYTPSGRHERYQQSHRLYWHSKGYATTMRVLEALARRYSIRLETLGGAQVSHAQSMAMKRRSHIVIDECVTGSYHRNSLEGVAAGSIVLNGLGLLPAIQDVFARCAGSSTSPFVHATLESLEQVLAGLIELGPDTLREMGARNRDWVEKYWNFEAQWNQFWEPVIDRALRSVRRVPTAPKEDRTAPASVTPVFFASKVKSSLVSAVVCQGGPDRLRQLGTCIASLRQSTAIGEIILVDMGSSPFAKDIGRRWADQYIFIRNDGLFERARCLNLGSALAQNELILWIDGDLLLPPEFLPSATAEMQRRNLDFLVPFSQVNYLSAPDTQEIQAGTRNPADCHAETVLRSVYGGAGLVKKSFLRVYGGMWEEFRGWGGEDDAWWHKAKLLGRAATTEKRDQPIYHLHHADAESFEKKKQGNPHYAANLALLRDMWSAKHREEFLRRFSSTDIAFADWGTKRVLILASPQEDSISAKTISEELLTLASIRSDVWTFTPGGFSLSDQEFSDADALLILNAEIAADVLTNEAFRSTWQKTIVLQTEFPARSPLPGAAKNAAAVVCTTASAASYLSEAGLDPWCANRRAVAATEESHIARALLQPLSIVFDGTTPVNQVASSIPHQQVPVCFTSSSISRVETPIWMYWEGDCPEWIRLCQATALQSGANVRLLTPSDFRSMRDADLDIDLERLHVAQRADFIRSYLLAKFGGLWLDSDCIVMKPLDHLLNLLHDYDFIAHRERTANLWANDFMAAAPNSKIAALLYSNICETLRSRKKIGWTDIGCLAVTRALDARVASWFELKVERIQPICWSTHAPFLETRTEAEHEKAFDRDAICYMLSNLTMQKSLNTTDLSSQLLRAGSFFRFLLDRAKSALSIADEEQRPAKPSHGAIGFSQPATSIFSKITDNARKTNAESVSGPGSSLHQTHEIRQRIPILLQALGVRSVLDAGCGDCNWMRHVDLGLTEYICADLLADLTQENQRRPTDVSSTFVTLDFTRDPLPKTDLILCRDSLVMLPFKDIARAIGNFKRSGARYLLATTFVDHKLNTDIAIGAWRPLNLQAAPFDFPSPTRLIYEKCDEDSRRFTDKALALWNLEDLPSEFPLSPVTVNSRPPFARPSRIVRNHDSKVQNDQFELSVIVPISTRGEQRERMRNLEACLGALDAQELDRGRYCVVVVEQDSKPHLEELCSTWADRYVFAKNQGAFNKSWAFNLGAKAVEASRALCLIDADMLPDRTFLSSGLERIQEGYRAVRPFSKVTYLDARSSEHAIECRMDKPDVPFNSGDFQGPSFPHAKGGCLFIETQLFLQIGGLDERFRGFGYEDTEFWNRVARHTTIEMLPGTLLHMHHARTVHGGGNNAFLFRQISNGRLAAWSGPMGDIEKYADESPGSNHPVQPLRKRSVVAASNGKRDTLSRRMDQVFSRMTRFCRSAGMESISGPGSTLAATAEIREKIQELLRELGAASMLDCGCGDFHWMQHVDLGPVHYTGVDLVEELVTINRGKFESTNRKFISANVISDPLPKTDVILCRDCLVHLPFEFIGKALRNFKASQATYLLMTHFTRSAANSDIALGEWRPLNLLLSPFALPTPIRIINEKCAENNGAYKDKSLALWRLADLGSPTK